MGDTFQLEILTYDKKCLSQKVKSVIIPAYEGLWGIERGHANSICLLKPGIVEVGDEQGERKKYAIGEGICHITPSVVTLFVRSFERKEDIDKERLSRKEAFLVTALRKLENYTASERKKIINAFLRTVARKKLIS